MIKNSLKYTKIYHNLSTNIDIALEYLENNNLKIFENGRYDIQGDNIYVNIQEYNTKPLCEGKWEAHKKYIDIQIMLAGSEKMGIGEIQDFTVIEEYDKDKDVEFLRTDLNQQFIELKENDYIILYPHDVHMPQIYNEKSSFVKKAVIKVSI